jgi:hypothetical protein
MRQQEANRSLPSRSPPQMRVVPLAQAASTRTDDTGSSGGRPLRKDLSPARPRGSLSSLTPRLVPMSRRAGSVEMSLTSPLPSRPATRVTPALWRVHLGGWHLTTCEMTAPGTEGLFWDVCYYVGLQGRSGNVADGPNSPDALRSSARSKYCNAAVSCPARCAIFSVGRREAPVAPAPI